MRLGVVMLVSLWFALGASLAHADEVMEEEAPAFDSTLEVVTDVDAVQEPAESDAALKQVIVDGMWAYIGLGAASAIKGRYFKTGGLDFALGLARSWRRVRLGGELRYTFLGGFDDPSDIYRYRVDIGPLHSVVLLERESLALSVGTRSLFSRAGTRRQASNGGSWECRADVCEDVGTTFHSIPYRAFYGFSATADLMLEWRGYFLRGSYMRTRWVADHGISAPKHQDWVHVSFGFSNPTHLTIKHGRNK